MEFKEPQLRQTFPYVLFYLCASQISSYVHSCAFGADVRVTKYPAATKAAGGNVHVAGSLPPPFLLLAAPPWELREDVRVRACPCSVSQSVSQSMLLLLSAAHYNRVDVQFTSQRTDWEPYMHAYARTHTDGGGVLAGWGNHIPQSPTTHTRARARPMTRGCARVTFI